MTVQQAPKAPTLPLPPAEYSQQGSNALVNSLRMYFNQLDAFNSALAGTAYQAPSVTLVSNTWYSVPAMFRLVINGTGNVSIDTTDIDGSVTTAAFVYIESGALNDTHTYLSETVSSIRAVFGSGLSVSLVL